MARLFELIETPEPGWTTRKLERCPHIGEEPTWLVELGRESDGATSRFEHTQLHVAWCRAVEQAHSTNIGLDKIEEAPPGERAVYNEPFKLDAEHAALAERAIEETKEAAQRSYDKVNSADR